MNHGQGLLEPELELLRTTSRNETPFNAHSLQQATAMSYVLGDRYLQV